MAKLKLILVPTDFSEMSEAAVDLAVGWAEAFEARVVLLHVMESPLYPFGFGKGSEPAIEKELRNAAFKKLEELAARYSESKAEVAPLLHKGHVFEQILHVAREEEADLVVMGTHGYSGLQHMMLGSVAERVVRLAPCPVLTVPAPE